MTEIETIGISLVLDNGVAEGMRRLHRDLAMFDRAVGQRAADLQRLAQRHLAPHLPMPRASASVTPPPAPRPKVGTPPPQPVPETGLTRAEVAPPVPPAPKLTEHRSDQPAQAG